MGKAYKSKHRRHIRNGALSWVGYDREAILKTVANLVTKQPEPLEQSKNTDASTKENS